MMRQRLGSCCERISGSGVTGRSTRTVASPTASPGADSRLPGAARQGGWICPTAPGAHPQPAGPLAPAASEGAARVGRRGALRHPKLVLAIAGLLLLIATLMIQSLMPWES